MGSNVDVLVGILSRMQIENEDLIKEFVEAAKKDSIKAAAIDRFFANATTSNPFNEGMSYYDLLKEYEAVQEEG